MKKILAIGLMGLAAVSAEATSVGILHGKSFLDGEFDSDLDKLGWDVTRYACTPEGMKEFAETSASLDFVLVPPLFNWKRENDGTEHWLLPEDGDYSMVRKYVENGGMIVVTEAQYKPCQEFFAKLNPDFSVVTGKCTSTQWVVLGHTSNVEPVHPLRCFPNVIVERDNWAHFDLPADTKWKTLAVCSEGKPTAIMQDYGKGCVVFISMRHNRLDALENYYAYAMVHRSGAAITRFSMPPLTAGDGRLEVDLAEPPKGETQLIYEFVGSGKKVLYSTNFVGKTATLDYNLALRGEVKSSLYLATEAGRVCLFSRTKEIPPLFVVKPNWYRGMLSTRRRVDKVDFKVEFAPDHEDLHGAKVSFDVFDACDNQVGKTTEHLMPTNGEVALEQWLPVPLSRNLGAATYRIDATLKIPATPTQRELVVKSSTNFEIRKPNDHQVMIDDDGTFIVDGKAFFPIGIYHCPPSDIPRISEIGFNTMQYWNWQVGGVSVPDWDRRPVLGGVSLAAAYGIRCIFEGCVGWGEDWRSLLANHPGTFAYYVADEPCEGAEPMMERNHRIWSEDKDHPSYLDSCRPDLFHIHQRYCDILTSNGGGIDILMGPATMGGHKACCATPGCERFQDPENPEVYRAAFYTGLAQGLRGLFWYCWSQMGGGPIGAGLKHQPKSQEVFKSMFAEARTMYPGLLSTYRRPFKVSDKVYGMVCGRDWYSHFLLLVNNSAEPTEVEITVPELKGVGKVDVPFNLPKVQKKNGKGEPVFDDKKKPVMVVQSIPVEKGLVKVELPAWGRLVYRW